MLFVYFIEEVLMGTSMNTRSVRALVLKCAVYCAITCYALTGVIIARKHGREELLWHLSKHWATVTTILESIGLVKVDIQYDPRVLARGIRNPHQAALILPTHESMLDGFIFHFLVRPAYVAKKELFSYPVFGYCMRMAGMISVDRKRPKIKRLLTDIEHAFDTGRQVIFFAEGRRKPPGTHTAVELGLSYVVELALLKGVPIIPVTVKTWHVWGPPNTLLQGLIGKPHLEVRVGAPLFEYGGQHECVPGNDVVPKKKRAVQNTIYGNALLHAWRCMEEG